MAAKRISKPESLLAALGIIGMEPIEPVILGALIGGEPLLLVGPHGTGKSYLLTRISAALGLELRHYNASLLNYDDLVGYPLPNGRGGLEFIQTPASIWGANAVFDEISRCRPDLQNKLFPIIHERRVQGILLDKLLTAGAFLPRLGTAGYSARRQVCVRCRDARVESIQRVAAGAGDPLRGGRSAG